MSSDLTAIGSGSVLTTELVAGFGGAIIGGLISLATAYYFYERQRRDERLAAAISLTTKIHRIADDTHKAKLIVDSAVMQGQGRPLWSAIQPMVGFGRDPVNLDTNEVAIFALRKDAAFVQDLFEASSFHRLLLDVIAEYSRRREQVGDRLSELGQVVSQEGGLRITNLDERAKAIIDPMITKVDTLANHLVEMCNSGHPRILIVANSFCSRARAALRDSRFDLELAFGKRNPGDG